MRRPSLRTVRIVLVAFGLWMCTTAALAAANHFLIRPDRSFVDCLEDAAVICALSTGSAFVLIRLTDHMKRTDRSGR